MAQYYIVSKDSIDASADAIRAKTGSQSAIEWDGTEGFADAIDAISGGGGSSDKTSVGNKVTLAWCTVTVGQNTVSNVSEAYAFFATALGLSNINNVDIIFTDDSNNTIVNNYISARVPQMNNGNYVYRYKNGAWGNAQVTTSYDAVLPVGSKYYVAAEVENV